LSVALSFRTIDEDLSVPHWNEESVLAPELLIYPSLVTPLDHGPVDVLAAIEVMMKHRERLSRTAFLCCVIWAIVNGSRATRGAVFR
jgi:hypothetical protein